MGHQRFETHILKGSLASTCQTTTFLIHQVTVIIIITLVERIVGAKMNFTCSMRRLYNTFVGTNPLPFDPYNSVGNRRNKIFPAPKHEVYNHKLDKYQ